MLNPQESDVKRKRFQSSKMLRFIIIYFSVLYFCLADSILNYAKILPAKQFHSLALCMCRVSKQDFSWKPTIVLNVGEDQKQSGSKSEFAAELIGVFVQKNTPFFTLESSDSESFDLNYGNYFYVEYFDPTNTLYDYKFDAIQRDVKYLWVLENYSEHFIADEDFIRIGRLVGEYDVIFFVKTIQLDHKIITFLPAMDETTCTIHFYPTQINTCNDGFLETSVVFPSKTPTNIMGCAINVGIGTKYPMAMIENQESLNTYDNLKGIKVEGTDVEIIKIMSEFSNASIYLYYILVYAENHFKYEHYLPFLLNGSLDVCAGGQYRIFGDQVEYSGVYARQLINWIYTADRPPLTWQNLILNIDGLYLFIIFYFVYSILWCIICVFDRHAFSMNDTLLYGWGALLGTASLLEAGTLKKKVLNIFYLYMCLHLSVYISIHLFSYFTISRPTEILRSNEDVMKSGRIPYLNHLNKYFIQDDKYEAFANTSVECTTFLDCTKMTLKNKGLTIIIDSYIYQIQDIVDTIVDDEAKILKPTENLLTVYHEMVIRKGSPIVGVLQKVVNRLFEAGITFKLYKDAIGITKVDKAVRAARNIMYPKYSCEEGCPINFGQISGALYLWAIGCGLAFALFVAEMLYGTIAFK